MRKLAAFLILLLVLLAVLDRVAVTGVQREIATRATAKYDLDTPPEVKILGIPFLTQAIAGRYDEVKVAAGPMSLAGVRLSSVDFTLYGVTAPLDQLVLHADQVNIRAERVAGVVVVPLETLNQRAPRGIKVEADGDGEGLNVNGEITVLGRKVPVKAKMKIGLDDGALRFVPEQVTLGGGIPVPQPERFLSYRVPIKDLPFDLKVTGVKTVPGGVQVTGEASDVPLHD
ncbi:LmeA family phospholipid-binding protein [Streptosporangium sp. CA-135522]|uniref:LmeA family phospholipid-binding protein n=1 Tax=Streptosporangium sp. CA-135522 TaxID=3240072 RepID=UPI003D8BBB3D